MAQIKALTPEGRLPTTAVTQVREMVPHPIQDIATSTDWVRAEVDEIGQIATATDSQGRTWINLHPDSPGVVDPEIASQLTQVDAPDWQWAVTDKAGNVALGVRADGTPYAGDSGASAPYDVILLVGQSNMQGRGAPAITHDNAGIFQYPAAGKANAGSIVPAVEPLQHPGPTFSDRPNGLGIPFARAYRHAHPGRRVLLVPAAYGGTGFSSAGPDTWDWTSTAGGDNLAVRAVAQAKAALVAAGPGARIAGILWHQGEGDSSISADYATRLDGLIGYLRGELGNVPVAVGQMSPDRTTGNADATVIDHAHQQTPSRIVGSAFAPTPPGLHNPGDTTHLSTRALDIIGSRLATALDRAVFNIAGIGPVGVENLAAHTEGDLIRVTWDAAWCRVTDYLVEWRVPGGSWATAGVDHSPALATSATLPAPAGGVDIRVTTVNADGSSTPVATSIMGAATVAEANTTITPTADWSTTSSTVIEARRSGSVVTITAWRLSVNSGVTGTVDAYEIPAGYRPPAMYDASTLDSRGKAVRLTNSNIVTITDPSGPVAHHTFTYITTDPFPV